MNFDDNHFNDILSRAYGTILAKDGDVGPEFATFCWWIFKKDYARINDALHGYLWLPDGTGRLLEPESELGRLIAEDPIARAERIKIKDYLKHINWIFHKTQNLPNIVLIGSDNIPERLHKLRNSKITLLDPKTILPKEKLFPDFMQRKRFRVVDSYDIFDVLNTTEHRLIGSQNVVIIDDCRIVFDAHELEQKILLAGNLLTEHGRCLFDLPMYGSAAQRSQLFNIARDFLDEPYRHNSLSATTLDDYVHEVVAHVKDSIPSESQNSWYFEIEDLKLTDVGLSRSVAMRVYLKKVFFAH